MSDFEMIKVERLSTVLLNLITVYNNLKEDGLSKQELLTTINKIISRIIADTENLLKQDKKIDPNKLKNASYDTSYTL